MTRFRCCAICFVVTAALVLGSCRSGPAAESPVAAGKFDEQLRSGEASLQSDPNQPKLLHSMAEWSLYRAAALPAGDEQRKALEQATRYADQAARLNPDDAAVLRESAMTFETAGDRSQPTRCEFYTRALELQTQRTPLLEELDSPAESSPAPRRGGDARSTALAMEERSAEMRRQRERITLTPPGRPGSGRDKQSRDDNLRRVESLREKIRSRNCGF